MVIIAKIWITDRDVYYNWLCFVKKQEKLRCLLKISYQKFCWYHKSPYLCNRFRSKTSKHLVLWKDYIGDRKVVQDLSTYDYHASDKCGRMRVLNKSIPLSTKSVHITDRNDQERHSSFFDNNTFFIQWRVWSWLRMNASYRLNTCKSRGSTGVARNPWWRPAHGCVTRIQPAPQRGIARRKSD